ncbi:hypothetical protein ILYODFUR_036799 [Ilyodon furcidens]
MKLLTVSKRTTIGGGSRQRPAARNQTACIGPTCPLLHAAILIPLRAKSKPMASQSSAPQLTQHRGCVSGDAKSRLQKYTTFALPVSESGACPGSTQFTELVRALDTFHFREPPLQTRGPS